MIQRANGGFGGSPAIGLMCLTVGVLCGCAGIGRGDKPAWIERSSKEFPSDAYLVGLGQADSQPSASARAYAAVARIFQATISAQAQDWDTYLLLEDGGKAQHERRLTLEQVTRVSTDKVLENVRILDAWFDPATGIHYALAGMHRAQAEAALVERITDLDRMVETERDTARRSSAKLATIKHLKRAADHLVLREAYNADLRVVRVSGRGRAAPHRVSELTAELEEFLAANLVVGIEMAGEQADTIRRAVMEGLIREGLPVTDRPIGSKEFRDDPRGSAPIVLVVKGSVRLWKADVSDPLFTYVRWCGDFLIIEAATERVVGAVSRRGREGHITDREAMTKAIRVMQQELTSDLARSLADHVYGDTERATDAAAPAACQRDEDTLQVPSTTQPEHSTEVSAMAKRRVRTKDTHTKPQRRTPSRMAKSRLLERIREDTKEVNAGSLTRALRKQGYEEIPLDELQDRLSRLRTPLADQIVSGRG